MSDQRAQKHLPFPETLWEQISAVRKGTDDRAMQQLASAYWRPLYFFIRSSGDSHEDASDHVQGFFTHVLSTGFFDGIEREGGKFRSYLLKSLRNWMARQYHHDHAQKRGGGVPHVPLEDLDALDSAPELAERGDAELLYDRRWAREIVARSSTLVCEEYAARDQAALFNAISGALPGGGGLPPYEELASRLGLTEPGARKAVFKLRHRFAESVRREIRATVASARDADEEFEHLFRVLNQH